MRTRAAVALLAGVVICIGAPTASAARSSRAPRTAPSRTARERTAPSTYSVIEVPDVLYSTPVPGTNTYLDVYEPDATGPFPGVVAVHGGGYRDGGNRKGQIALDASNLAAEGFVTYAIDYRSACNPRRPPPGTDPSLCGFTAPAPEHDIRTAIQWVRTNATTYDTDPTHVGVFGVSTGGTYANMATIDGTAGADRGDAVVAWSGEGDLTYQPDGSRAVYIGCAYTVCPKKWDKNSPTFVVQATSAPLYLSGGEYDPQVAFAVEKAEIDRYTSLSVPNQWHMLYGVKCHARGCVDVDPSIWTESVAWFHMWLDPS